MINNIKIAFNTIIKARVKWVDGGDRGPVLSHEGGGGGGGQRRIMEAICIKCSGESMWNWGNPHPTPGLHL